MDKSVFLSFRFKDRVFVDWVHYFLSQQGITPHYWPEDGHAGSLSAELTTSIDASAAMIVFLGELIGEIQKREIEDVGTQRAARLLEKISRHHE